MVERIRLVSEIAGAYVRARRKLAHAPITTAVAELRAQAPRSPPCRVGDPRVEARGQLVKARGQRVEARDPLVEARDLGRAVVRTLALLPGDTRCLTRSLVLTRLLARRGIPATLVIGTRSTPSFAAHAWVEHAGQPVLSPGDGSFGRIVEL